MMDYSSSHHIAVGKKNNGW